MTLAAGLRDLTHRDRRVRVRAADALGEVGPDEAEAAVRALVAAADDLADEVRYAALSSLAELAHPAGLGAARDRLDDGVPRVREAALIALGRIGAGLDAAGREAVRAEVAACLARPEPEVRFQAIGSLVELDPDGAAADIQPLLGDDDAEVRAQAACALGDLGALGAVPALVARLDDEERVRFEAALALSRLNDRRGIAALLEGLDVEMRALDAATGLAAVGVAGDEAALRRLSREVRRWFGDPLVKLRAAEALARAGQKEGRAHLERAARARREDVRGLAREILDALKEVA